MVIKHHPAFSCYNNGTTYWRIKMDNKIFQELVLSGFSKMDSQFDKMDSRFDKLEQMLEQIEIQTKENTRILKMLEQMAEIVETVYTKSK